MFVPVRYFDYESGVKIKILELKLFSGDTSVTVCKQLSNCIIGNDLVGKVVGLCADNTNSNFGGAGIKGQNTVFTQLQKTLGHGVI
jgi:hypothetical protein